MKYTSAVDSRFCPASLLRRCLVVLLLLCDFAFSLWRAAFSRLSRPGVVCPEWQPGLFADCAVALWFCLCFAILPLPYVGLPFMAARVIRGFCPCLSLLPLPRGFAFALCRAAFHGSQGYSRVLPLPFDSAVALQRFFKHF